MSTPRSTRRSARKAAQSSRIPRPSWKDADKDAHHHTVGDSASPQLGRNNKRRHASEPGNNKHQKDDEQLRSPVLKQKRTNALLSEASPRRSPRYHTPSAINQNSTFTLSPHTEEINRSAVRSSKRRRSSSEPAFTDIRKQSESSRKKARKSPSCDRTIAEKETAQVLGKETADDLKENRVEKEMVDGFKEIKIDGDVENVPLVSQEDDDDMLGLTVSTPTRHNSGRRKSKRRSSFVRGRISKVVPVVSDVSLNIPEDLPPEDRLQMLSVAVGKYTQNRLEEELPDLQGMQQFQVEVVDAIEKFTRSRSSQSLFKESTCTNRFLPNPANAAIEKKVEDLLAAIERLKSEFDRWTSVYKHREEEAARAERELQEVDDNPIREPPSSGLTKNELSFLKSRPDYNQLLGALHRQREVCMLVVPEVLQVTGSLKQFQLTANTVIAEHAQKIHRETFGDIEDFDRPDKLLESVISLKG